MAQKAIHVNIASTDPKNIAAGDDAAVLSGLIGGLLASTSGILAFGDRLDITKLTNNSVKVSTGVYLNQGHAVRVTTDETLTILSGTQGKQRIDLIVSEFKKGAERDTHVIKVVQGSLYDSDPVAPTLTAENLHGSGTTRQEEIGRVFLSGTEITSVAKTAPVIKGLTELTGTLADLISGAQKAGDADKLDGQDSSQFLLKSLHGTTITGVAGSLLSFALNDVDAGHSKAFYTSTNTTDLPTGGSFSYSSGLVLKRSATSITVVIFDYYNSGRFAVNGYSSGWKGWKIFESDVAFGSTVPSSLRPGQLFVKI